MPVIIGALRMALKDLVRGLEVLEIVKRTEDIKSVALLRCAIKLRRVLEIWGDLLSLELQYWNHQPTLVLKTRKVGALQSLKDY